jgi:hypothetical protein
MNAANMWSMNGLDLSRTWTGGGFGGVAGTVALRPLLRRDLPGYLCVDAIPGRVGLPGMPPYAGRLISQADVVLVPCGRHRMIDFAVRSRRFPI